MPQADAKNIAVDLELAGEIPEVRMDKTAVAEALDNLLDNAIKYSPEGARVVIRIEKRQRYYAWKFRIKESGLTQTTCRAFSTGFTGADLATSKTCMAQGSDSRWSRPPPKGMGELSRSPALPAGAHAFACVCRWRGDGCSHSSRG